MDFTLVAGRDYPNTYREFVAMFPDDRACATYLAQLHWPEGFICPACERGSTPWTQSRGRLVCPACRHQTSVTAGTIFDKTRTSLTTGCEAAWHVTTAKNGLSAKTLERTLGFGRVRMRHVSDASGASLLPFVRDMGASEAVVLTDGWDGYNGLPQLGYTRKAIVRSSSGDPAHVSMPGVHRVASLLKRWILGTHQGSIVPAHLQSYLEEFTVRFNRRTSRSRGLVFRRLLEQAVVTRPVTEADVTDGYDWPHQGISGRS